MTDSKKRRVVSTKKIECSRCGRVTTHTLYNAESKVYKCNICGTEVSVKK